MFHLSIKKQLFLKLLGSTLLLILMLTMIIFLIVSCLKEKNRDYELLGTEEALILIDEKHPLPDNYHTKLLVYDKIMVSSKIKNNLDLMMEDSCHDLVCLSIMNGYLENSDRVSGKLEKESNSLQMEHRSGLAVDFYQENQERKNIKMYEWLEKNAYRYGFVLQDEKCPWHYRFVGIKHAKIMNENNLSFQEYLKEKEGI